MWRGCGGGGCGGGGCGENVVVMASWSMFVHKHAGTYMRITIDSNSHPHVHLLGPSARGVCACTLNTHGRGLIIIAD